MQILKPTGETNDVLRRYPWEVWLELDGQPRVIDRDTDFPNITAANMRVYLYSQALKHSLKVTSRILERRYIIYQVYENTEAPPKLPQWKPTGEKPKCRYCKKPLDTYSIPFGEHRVPRRPNQRSCK